ncbi:MAG: cation transporter, partial [Geminicoccaceae bacterium]
MSGTTVLDDPQAETDPEASDRSGTPEIDPQSYIQSTAGGSNTLHMMVDNVHCGGCMRKIERAVGQLSGVDDARLNLTTRRLTVRWTGPKSLGDRIIPTLAALGYPAKPYDPA